MQVVIVGGVAGGASVAARLRRLDERANIVILERGPHVSFANCGLPYHIGGVIVERELLLVQTPESLKATFDLDVRVNSEVLSIDRAGKTVRVRELADGREYALPYDKLVLSPGAAPIVPPLPGLDLPGVFTLRNIPDMDALKSFVERVGPQRAAVIGGGFIGIEVAENLQHRGVRVSLVEMLDQVIAPVDYELAAIVQQHMRSKGIDLILGDGLKAVEPGEGGRMSVLLQSGRRVEAGMVVLAIGVRPESALAREAGLTLGLRGTVATSAHMQTSDPDIYAIGDVAQTTHLVSGEPANVPLAGPASKQGRIVADHMAGRDARYRGVQGTSAVKVFDLTVAATGLNRRQLEQAGIPFHSVAIHPGNHAGYYPGAAQMALKLLFSPEGRILGAQGIGPDGVDKRIDVIATALRGGLTVFDLEELELAYAPPYGSARDPVNQIGFVASNVLRGDLETIDWDAVAGLDPARDFILDVRNPPELLDGAIERAVNIPLPELRTRVGELPRDRRIVVYCQAGHRAYYAYRMLVQHGYHAVSLSGGYRTYAFATGRPIE